jgi:hypothetical protein
MSRGWKQKSWPRLDTACCPFTGTAVAAACGFRCPEIDCSRIRDGDFWMAVERQSSMREPVYRLWWKTPEPSNLGFLLAISHDLELLGILQDYHRKLRQELEENREVAFLVGKLREAVSCEKRLRDILSEVVQMADLPGHCRDCQPFRQ